MVFIIAGAAILVIGPTAIVGVTRTTRTAPTYQPSLDILTATTVFIIAGSAILPVIPRCAAIT